MIEGRQIVCVGFNDWGSELWTNQHHLMARLAAGNRVLFVESLGLRRPTLAGRDLRRIWARLRRGLARPRRPLEGADLHVLSPLVLPLHSRAWARAVNRRLLRWSVARAARRLEFSAPILWGYVPQAEELIGALQPGLVVYHCVDDISAHERIDTDSFLAAERRYARRADLVFASAPPLAERMRRLSAHVRYLPNVADTELFASALDAGPVDPALAALPSPRLLFTGAIAGAKLDFELLCGIADARPDWSIALVGPVGLGDPHTKVGQLERRPNIHLLGARTYAQLPTVLRGADVALIPYALNPLTAGIFPMKVYEYMAAGLPIVATPLPSLKDVEGVTFAADATATIAATERMLAEPGDPRARSALADGHSWDVRMAEIDACLTSS